MIIHKVVDVIINSRQQHNTGNHDHQRDELIGISRSQMNMNDMHAAGNGTSTDMSTQSHTVEHEHKANGINITNISRMQQQDANSQPDGDVPVRILNNHPSFNLDPTEQQTNNLLLDVHREQQQNDAIKKVMPTGCTTTASTNSRNSHAEIDNGTGGGGSELPIVERLPSRNVSFQSADILTIPELSQSIHLKNAKHIGREKSLRNGAHVRVTGVILHMHVGMQMDVTTNAASISSHSHSINDKCDPKPCASSCGNVNNHSWIVLGDALFVPRKKTPMPTSTSTFTPKINQNQFSSKNGIVAKSKNIRVNKGSRSKLGTSQLLSGKKRRLITVKPNHNSLLGRSKDRSSIIGNKVTSSNGKISSLASTRTSMGACKAPSSSASLGKQKLNSIRPTQMQAYSSRIEDDMRQKSRRGMNMVVVDITNMSCIDGCKVGDLTMVMGCVVLMDNGDDDDDITSHSKSTANNTNRRNAHNIGTNCADVSYGNVNEGTKYSHGLDRIAKFVGLCQTRATDMREKCGAQDVSGDNPNSVPLGKPSSLSTSPSSSGYRCGYVDARIVKVVNGTDMNLFQQALKMRRACLQ